MDEDSDQSFSMDRDCKDIIWSHEDITKLLDLILKHLPPNLHKDPYLTQVSKVPWPIIAQEMGNKERLECQEAFHTLVNGMDAAKNITRVIPEVKNFLSKETNIDLSTLYGFIYYIKRMSPKKRNKTFSESTCYRNWLKLSSDSKKGYILKMMDILNIPKPNVSTVQVFNKLQIGSASDNWKRYSRAKIAIKVEVLQETVQDMDRYLLEVKEYKKIVPNWIAPPPILPSERDMKLYIIKGAELPQIEYASAKKLYYAENPEANKTRSFKCPQEYIEKYQQMVNSYKDKLTAWKCEQSSATLFIYNKLFDAVSAVTQYKEYRKRHKKVPWVEKETALYNVEFHNEPIPENTDKLKLYFESLCVQNDNFHQKYCPKDMRDKWKKLPPNEREHFSNLARANQENYADQLLIYIRTLDEDMRRIFIGFRRAKAFKVLKRDIFKEEFPSEKYPVYVNQSRSCNSPTDDDSSDVESDYDLECPPILKLDNYINDNQSDWEEGEEGSDKESEKSNQPVTPRVPRTSAVNLLLANKRKREETDTVKQNSKRKTEDSVSSSQNSKDKSDEEIKNNWTELLGEGCPTIKSEIPVSHWIFDEVINNYNE